MILNIYGCWASVVLIFFCKREDFITQFLGWPLKFCLILRNVFFHKRRKSLGVFTSEGIEHRIASSLGVCEIATEKSFQFWASICISEQLILRESHSSSKWNGYKSDGRRHVEFLPTSCIKSENCLIIQKLQGKQHHKLTL